MKKTSFLASVLLSLSIISVSNAALINEFAPNPDGGDPSETTVELLGNAGDMFNGWILSIESDNTTAKGSVDRASQVSGMFDANGILEVLIPDLENPSFTLVLTSQFQGSIGDDIDANDDGAVDDLASFGTVFDAIGIIDSAADSTFGAAFGGIDFLFTGVEPELMFRDGLTQDWYAVNDVINGNNVIDENGNDIDPSAFNINPIQYTFGDVNPFIPQTSDVNAPATMGLFALVLCFIAMRKKTS